MKWNKRKNLENIQISHRPSALGNVLRDKWIKLFNSPHSNWRLSGKTITINSRFSCWSFKSKLKVAARIQIQGECARGMLDMTRHRIFHATNFLVSRMFDLNFLYFANRTKDDEDDQMKEILRIILISVQKGRKIVVCQVCVTCQRREKKMRGEKISKNKQIKNKYSRLIFAWKQTSPRNSTPAIGDLKMKLKSHQRNQITRWEYVEISQRTCTSDRDVRYEWMSCLS